MSLERVTSIEEVRGALARPRLEGRTIGLVTTMGALHEGHLSLVRASKARCDLTVVTVFVNPVQFGPGEDFEAYPRDLEADLSLLAAEDVDIVFSPSVDTMYPAGATTRVDPGPMGTVWCGATRPGHFVGVATVVVKMFDIVRPDIAFFGEKDYQQLKVIERVVRDLDLPVRVVGCPIVRTKSGLALSSRNAYLSPDDRVRAAVLSRALGLAREAAAGGETDAAVLTRMLSAEVAAEPGVRLDYAAVIDPETLSCVTRVQRPCRALVAAYVGDTRLIDNVAIEPPAA
jgi:pantoate--beta-alanine ligase